MMRLVGERRQRFQERAHDVDLCESFGSTDRRSGDDNGHSMT